ncbi:hypothetical protein DSO57_1018262 [Entomophthora muscae]|uniref:Uncharacterized protein n=1 Tax=Entomophthora muscae TaxID=34485 RepID=A0ACC2U2S7_9FUNG|nr:hypothetical protein DSO57_1018262 [Entomophthora muscae]
MKFTGSKVVFVGNIPYDVTEASMIEIFQEVGPVAAFRINKDRDTGKPKGYGFCEFHDAATAASAVRNLDGHDLGGRQLRVAPAESDNPPASFAPSQVSAMVPPRSADGMGASNPQFNHAAANNESQGKNVSGPTPCTDAINATLASMSPGQIFELLTQINIMVQYSPGTARTFLSQNPQLCYALFQALVILNLIDKDVITKSSNTASPPGHNSRPVMHNPQPIYPPNYPQQPIYPNPQMGFQPPLMGQGNLPPPPFPPPFMNQHLPPFVPHMNSPTAPSAPTPHGDQHSALLLQVMQMTPDQIDQLPPEQRNSLHLLRAQLLGGQQSHNGR